MSPPYGYLNSSKIFFIRFSLVFISCGSPLDCKAASSTENFFLTYHVICQESSRLQHLGPTHSFSSLPQLDKLLSLSPTCMHCQSKYYNWKCLKRPQNQPIHIRNGKLHWICLSSKALWERLHKHNYHDTLMAIWHHPKTSWPLLSGWLYIIHQLL